MEKVRIKLEGISKSYYSETAVTQALRKINLTFQMGEFVAITGESGSGKSTLLNCVATIDSATSGRIVLGAEFALQPDDGGAEARMADYAARRREKQPLSLPSAGSTFKRPEGHFAGALIEQAGLKGTRVGGAEVSTLHAGFVVNVGGAAAKDITDLIALVQRRVLEHSGVRLEPEVKIIGEEA